MKLKRAFFLFFLLLFIPSVSSLTASSCLTSSENYAVEAVLTDYNLFSLGKLANIENGKYIFPSQYNTEVLTIIERTNFPEGLSVKLQIPTKLVETQKPYLKLVSSNLGFPKKDLSPLIGGWRTSCTEEECSFKKGDISLTSQDLADFSEVSLELNKELPNCSESCSGICFSATTSSKCIESKDKIDLDIILRASNLSSGLEEFLDSYRITGSENLEIAEIKPTINPYINWREAMRQELVFLTNAEVLNLKRDEIESIVDLAKLGQAGQNYRIVNLENSWSYYDKTENPILTGKRDCSEYGLSSTKSKEARISTFYTIPLIFAISGFIILAILATIAKLITSRQKRSSSHEKV